MEAACSREPVPNASGSVSAGEVQSPGSCFSLGSTPPARTPRQATGPGHANRTDADATPSEQFSLGSTPSEQFSLGSTPGAMSAASAASPAPQLRTPDPAVDLGHEAHILSDIMRELDAEDEAAEEEEDALRMFSMEPGAAPSGGTTGPKDQLHQSAHDLEAEFGIDELYSEHCESCAEDEPGAAAHALVTGFPHSLGVQSDACHQHSNKESVLALADVPKQAGTLVGLYEGFVCKCTRGPRHGGSCIQELKVSQLKQARCLLEPPRKSSSSGAPTHARTKLHELMWAMKAPLARPNYRGHNFKIPKWTYDGTVLCRHGWMKLVGGSYQAHRDMYSLVLRGLSPHEIDCAKGAALLEKCAAQVQGDLTEKQSYTTAWIQNVYLATMEYMPNENRIVLRGGGYSGGTQDALQPRGGVGEDEIVVQTMDEVHEAGGCAYCGGARQPRGTRGAGEDQPQRSPFQVSQLHELPRVPNRLHHVGLRPPRATLEGGGGFEEVAGPPEPIHVRPPDSAPPTCCCDAPGQHSTL